MSRQPTRTTSEALYGELNLHDREHTRLLRPTLLQIQVHVPSVQPHALLRA